MKMLAFWVSVHLVIFSDYMVNEACLLTPIDVTFCIVLLFYSLVPASWVVPGALSDRSGFWLNIPRTSWWLLSRGQCCFVAVIEVSNRCLNLESRLSGFQYYAKSQASRSACICGFYCFTWKTPILNIPDEVMEKGPKIH